VLSEDELIRLRRSIDQVDNQILTLLAERAALVRSVGDYKRESQLPVYDPERERRVIARLVEQAPAGVDAEMVQRVFERIIDESRRLEHRHAKV
jgi:chorismate mutase